MLKNLLIRNYALIEELALEPHQALNIVTGETGAGKSIMLGAIGLLLGQRADGKVVAGNGEKCIVEATFNIDGYNLEPFFTENDLDFSPETIIRREINASGKSRLFINDLPSTLEVAKNLGAYLIDIHSQHDTLQLGNGIYQLNLLDNYAQNSAEKEAYRYAYLTFKEAEQHLNTLQSLAKKESKELEFNKFQLKELKQAGLKPGEQEELEQELKLIDNAADIKLKLSELTALLDESSFPIISQLKTSTLLLQKLSQYHENYAGLSQRAKNCLIELRDIADEVFGYSEKLDVDADRLTLVQERLSLIYNLLNKHSLQTVEELLALQNLLDDSISSIENLSDTIKIAQEGLDNAKHSLERAVLILSETRKNSAQVFTEAIHNLFDEVGMPNATLQFQITDCSPNQTGANQVQILFSANKGIPPKELKQVASGGEFSRLMLSVKYLMASKTQLPTIIFDEIDAGISGETAQKVSRLIDQMSQHHQIIAITHLPQLASKGMSHYFVYKDNSGIKTISKIKLLEKEGRIEEIAQMISGTPISANARAAAKELLEKQ